MHNDEPMFEVAEFAAFELFSPNVDETLGRLTGLGRGVVTQRVDRAIEMGFLEDGEFGPSSGGRAPRTLRFRSTAGRIVVDGRDVAKLAEGELTKERQRRFGFIFQQFHLVADLAVLENVLLRQRLLH